MEYNIDQTFNYYDDPTNYKTALSTVKYDIIFDTLKNWRTTAEYRALFRDGSCGDELAYLNADFIYTFLNLTRVIDEVIVAYENWNIGNKHPPFYSGTTFSNKEYFLIDEFMFLRGEYGIIQRQFDYIGLKNISLHGKNYETFEFRLNTTIGDYGL